MAVQTYTTSHYLLSAQDYTTFPRNLLAKDASALPGRHLSNVIHLEIDIPFSSTTMVSEHHPSLTQRHVGTGCGRHVNYFQNRLYFNTNAEKYLSAPPQHYTSTPAETSITLAPGRVFFMPGSGVQH
jgi:hypothetical protein